MPDSGSPSAADRPRLEERSGEVSAHTWPAFTPIPWHLLLALPERILAGQSFALELAGLHPLLRSYFSSPKGAVCSQGCSVRWGSEPAPSGGPSMGSVPPHAGSTACVC